MLRKAEQVSLNSALHSSKTVPTCWDSFEEKNSSEDLITAEGMLQKVSHLTEPLLFWYFADKDNGAASQWEAGPALLGFAWAPSLTFPCRFLSLFL